MLLKVNEHMNKNPCYPGDWFIKFYYDTRETYKFKDMDEMILEIGKAFRNTDEKWCNQNIIGYSHSETNKNQFLSKTPETYDEKTEPVRFWERFLAQMLIYRYG